MYELIYTSVPKGLIPGRSGFATVAMSEGMPPNLIVPLENLSGYNFTLRDGNFLPILNPPCCYYIKMRYGNQQLHVAGRVAPNGLDYSKRNNKIAHQLLFESAEELENLAGGVGGLFFQAGVFRSEYTEEPAMLPFRKVPICMQTGQLPAKNWAEMAGHAGFAAYAAERFRKNPDKPLYLIYQPGTPTDKLLTLVMEVSALLNERLRNYFTFSTYFGSCAASVDCFLRMIPDFSPLVNNLRRFHKKDVIELGQENELPLPDNYSDIYEYACTGRKPDLIKPREQEESLTQHTIQILADSGLPPEPVRELLNEAPAITVPPPPPVNYRKFVFAGAVAVIIAAVCSLLLYDIPNKTQVPPHMPGKVVSTAPQLTLQPVPEAQTEPVEPPANRQTTPVKDDMPTPGTAVKPVPAAVKTPVVKPSRQQHAGDLFSSTTLRSTAKKMPGVPALELFMEFHQGTVADKNSNNSSIRINLPEFLHGSSEIYPVMERIGTSQIDNSKFVCKGSVSGEVYVRAAKGGALPLKPLAGEIMDVPHLMIKLAADKKSLQIMKYTGGQSVCIMPQAAYIKQIYFRKQDKVYLWDNKFSPLYIAMIKPGKLVLSPRGSISYTPSILEKKLTDWYLIQTRFGKCSKATFLGKPFSIQEWNSAVKEYNAVYAQDLQLKKQIAKMAIPPTPPRTGDDIQKMLKDLHKLSDAGDFATFTTEFNKFIKSLFNPEEKNLIKANILNKQTEIMCSSLKNQMLDKNKRIQLEKLKHIWLAKIRKLQKFHDLQKNIAANSKKLASARENLKISGESIKSQASQVHIDIEKLLLKMMTVTGMTNWQLAPDVITDAEINELSKAVTGKINFEPVIILENK